MSENDDTGIRCVTHSMEEHQTKRNQASGLGDDSPEDDEKEEEEEVENLANFGHELNDEDPDDNYDQPFVPSTADFLDEDDEQAVGQYQDADQQVKGDEGGGQDGGVQEGSLEPGNQLQIVTESSKILKSTQFHEIDSREVQNVVDGGARPSKHLEIWVTNAFNEWREFKGFDMSKTIGELSEEEDLFLFIDMLHNFSLQVTKKDGSLYLPQFIQSMLRGIGCVIQLQQEKRIIKTSKLKMPFDIMKDVRYRRVKMAGIESVKRSFRRGLGTRVSTNNLLTRKEEILVLLSEGTSINIPHGLNARTTYYSCRNMFIRGQDGLRATNVFQFELLDVDGVDTLRHKLTLSKNYKLTIDRCSSHSLRRPIDMSNPDIVKTWKVMVSHWPKFDKAKLKELFDDLPHPIFFMPKVKFNSKMQVWYQKRASGTKGQTDR